MIEASATVVVVARSFVARLTRSALAIAIRNPRGLAISLVF